MARARHAGAGARWGRTGAVSALLLLGVAGGGLYLTSPDAEPERSVSAPVLAPSPETASPTPSSAPPSAASSSPSSSSPGPTASGRSGALPEALLDCGRAVRAAEQVVRAGSRGRENWGAHVQAYRDVVDGNIAYREADREWKRTKAAGGTDVARFDKASEAYEPTGGACRGVDGEAGGTSAALARSCAERAEAADAAVRRADDVMERWEDHLEQMAQRESHRLGDAQARRLFRAAVQKAPGEIEALQRAEDRLERAPECDVPA